MAKIQVLDRQMAELIAAGEVVERPASVVKELVENAIDAGAAAITVEIQNGGIRYIRVTDNGCGIPYEEVPTAFLRHATSKVRSQEDLYCIGTLGFRGEALASVAAVAHVEILTKTAGEPLGARYTINGGVPGLLEEAGCPNGTTILVKDLFYNIPARMKFLKKDVSEGNAVATLLDHLALSHPDISFKLIRDGQLKLHTPGDNRLLSAIYAVYGSDFGGGLLPVESTGSGVTVSGFITKPEKSRASRSMEHFFINGRYIRSSTMLSALEEAYRNRIMSGKFPGCVLAVFLPYGMVDVNVHPAKLEVKIADERLVFDNVYNACKSALMKLDNTVQATDTSRILERKGGTFVAPIPQWGDITQPGSVLKCSPSAVSTTHPIIHGERANGFGQQTYSSIKNQTPSSPVKEEKFSVSKPFVQPKTLASNPILQEQLKSSRLQEELATQLELDGAQKQPIYFIGEAFCTYLLAQRGEELLLVDKHAAHERILFEKLKAAHQAGAVDRQVLLTSVRVALPKDRCDAILQNLSLLEQAGFEVEDFGDGVLLVREVPAILENGQIENTIEEIAEMLLKGYSHLELEIFDELYHSIACKAAIKGSSFTGAQEGRELVELLQNDQSIRNCPHGRPVMIAVKKRELEKMFGRIV